MPKHWRYILGFAFDSPIGMTNYFYKEDNQVVSTKEWPDCSKRQNK